jgi:hypothetical protein
MVILRACHIYRRLFAFLLLVILKLIWCPFSDLIRSLLYFSPALCSSYCTVCIQTEGHCSVKVFFLLSVQHLTLLHWMAGAQKVTLHYFVWMMPCERFIIYSNCVQSQDIYYRNRNMFFAVVSSCNFVLSFCIFRASNAFMNQMKAALNFAFRMWNGSRVLFSKFFTPSIVQGSLNLKVQHQITSYLLQKKKKT